MDADQIFSEQVERWRREPWEALRRHLKKPVVYEVTGPSGKPHQFEVLIFWDGSRREGNLRVLITGDEGKGWKMRGMRTEDFIKAPDGTFVGE